MVAIEARDINSINKLRKLNDINTYWDQVRKITKNLTSDHAIGRWQLLSELRYEELKQEAKK